MMIKRDSRPDTLNQLISPKNQFELSMPTLGMAITGELLSSSEESPEPPVIMDINRIKSAKSFDKNSIGRKVNMKTQGGGFNRTANSGYFKGNAERQAGRQHKINLNKTQTVAEIMRYDLKSNNTQSQVFVEERRQILPNEVWANQNRGMP